MIILDDCSTDGSRDIIDDYTSRFPFITSYYNSINSGSPFIQWDAGVNKAKGEFIWIAESDDFAEPSFLERTTSVMNENTTLGLVYCDSKVTDESNKSEYFVSEKKTLLSRTKWLHDYLNTGRKEIADYLYLANTISNVSGVLFRKSKYSEAGFANHSLKFCGDWFIYLRILLISDVAYIAEPLNNYRLHADSTFHSYFNSNTYLKEVIKIYSFVINHIRLAPKKKFLMAVYLLRIILRRLLHLIRIGQA
jgi:glycosyltransferase involved in cell wall biosynthesis